MTKQAAFLGILPVLWYNIGVNKNITDMYCTPYQLKLPLELSILIDATDPVCTLSEVVNNIDLTQCFAVKECKTTGRPQNDVYVMLKLVLLGFMEEGYISLRSLEKKCHTDIRYMWLLGDMKAPSHMTFANFINHDLCCSVETIFQKINQYIFEKEHVDLDHVYIDGTKIEANANKYTWVWKKSCLKNRDKLYAKITVLLEKINNEVIFNHGMKFDTREEYAIEYLESIQKRYMELVGVNTDSFVKGRGHKKKTEQKDYELLDEYIERLKKYADHIKICGNDRNSYSKTDHDATFMRLKKDYMGNDQLLPAYNMQIAVCDEYIAAITAEQYASDMDCFIPLMEEYYRLYGKYPEYPTGDAGFGSYNNYLYCEEHGMKKFLKFPMYEKTVKNDEYRDNPYRAVNFQRNEEGKLVCPEGKVFSHLRDVPVRGNKYGRTEELHICEDCSNCPSKSKCHKGKGNRIIHLNQELTSIHKEVIDNLQSIHGALLCMNRSIQAEGTFGVMKWDRSYKRLFRRGKESVILEFRLISCGYNLYKYHNKRIKAENAA